MIRLHSSAAFPVNPNLFEADETYIAVQHCLDAVGKIIEITHYVETHEMIDRLGPPFAFTVWVAARVLLVHGSATRSVHPKIIFLIDLLHRMGNYWQVARSYGELLSRVYGDYRTAGSDHPASVRILADMRRCAFDLLFSMEPTEERTAHPDYQRSNDALRQAPTGLGE